MDMRGLIAIVENQSFADPACIAEYGHSTPQELEHDAKMVEGNCQDEVASDFVWHFDPAFPLAETEWLHKHTAAAVAQWFANEQEMAAEANENPAEYVSRWDDLADGSLIRAPIVVHLDGQGIGWIWDGYHRAAASIVYGRSTIPAIVGVRKTMGPKSA